MQVTLSAATNDESALSRKSPCPPGRFERNAPHYPAVNGLLAGRGELGRNIAPVSAAAQAEPINVGYAMLRLMHQSAIAQHKGIMYHR